MPNHVKNIVKMEGIVNLPLFRKEDGKQCFDFNKIIPLPESLNIERGSMTDEAILYYLTEKCTVPISCLCKEKLELAKELISVISSDVKWLKILFEKAMERAYKTTESERNELYQKGQIYISNHQKYGHTTW